MSHRGRARPAAAPSARTGDDGGGARSRRPASSGLRRGRVVEPVVRGAEEREVAQEGAVTSAALRPGVTAPPPRPAWNVLSTSGTVTPAMARSAMLTTSSTTRRPLGKPARSPPSSPNRSGLRFGLIAVFSRSMSAWTSPVSVGEAVDQPGRDAGEQDRHQVGPRLLRLVQRVQVSEDTRVERGQQRGQLRLLDEPGEPLVLRGRQRVPQVLLGHRHDDLVEQRVAEPGDLGEGAGGGVRGDLVAEHPHLLAGRGRPHPDRRGAVA